MDIRRIRYFLALCDTLNFSRCARRLHISQPALSKAMQRLEAEVGGKLIRREGRLTHLTPLGQAMRVHFQRLDERMKETEMAAAKLVRRTATELHIGVLHGIGPNRVARFLADFVAKHRQARLRIDVYGEAGLRERLYNGCIDCALLVETEGGDDSRLHYIPLYTECLAIAHAPDHAFSNKPALALENLTGERLLPLACAAQERGVAAAVTASATCWTLALAGEGIGVALVSEETPAGNSLAITAIEDSSARRRIALAVPAGRYDNVTLRAFVDAVQRYDWFAGTVPGSVVRPELSLAV